MSMYKYIHIFSDILKYIYIYLYLHKIFSDCMYIYTIFKNKKESIFSITIYYNHFSYLKFFKIIFNVCITFIQRSQWFLLIPS